MARYEIYDLGGNPTAIIFIEGEISPEQIMKDNPEVEQVAIIQSVKGDVCTFKMAGGEFCGNACRAVAEFMRRNYNKSKCKIIINGIVIDANSDGKTSQIQLEQNSLVKTCFENFVIMNGITHVIVKGQGNETQARKIKKDANDRGITSDAFGVMFLDGNAINPFVWVETAKTFYNETACLSGSIAAAIYLGATKIEIIQPTGSPYLIAFDGKTITAKGEVKYVSGT